MDVVQAVKAGVDAYIVKPFTQEGLEAKVAKLVPQAAELSAVQGAIAEAQHHAASAEKGSSAETQTHRPSKVDGP